MVFHTYDREFPVLKEVYGKKFRKLIMHNQQIIKEILPFKSLGDGQFFKQNTNIFLGDPPKIPKGGPPLKQGQGRVTVIPLHPPGPPMS